MKLNFNSIGKLAISLARNMATDLVIRKAQELIVTAENSGLSGEEKRRQVMEKLRATPGEVSKQIGAIPTYLQNLLLEALVAEALGRLKIN